MGLKFENGGIKIEDGTETVTRDDIEKIEAEHPECPRNYLPYVLEAQGFAVDAGVGGWSRKVKL